MKNSDKQTKDIYSSSLRMETATQISPVRVTRKVEDIVERSTGPNANTMLFNSLDNNLALPDLSDELQHLV
jgi:hypothetical protein